MWNWCIIWLQDIAHRNEMHNTFRSAFYSLFIIIYSHHQYRKSIDVRILKTRRFWATEYFDTSTKSSVNRVQWHNRWNGINQAVCRLCVSFTCHFCLHFLKVVLWNRGKKNSCGFVRRKVQTWFLHPNLFWW